jgi:hypothetical protein
MAMVYEAEPFCTYLTQNVEESVLRKICSFESDYVDAIVIQYTIASKLEDKDLIKKVETQEDYLREESNLKLVPVAPFQQISSIVRVQFNLNKVWSRSPVVKFMTHEEYNYQFQQVSTFPSLSEVDERARNRVKRKFLMLAKLLDLNELYLGEVDLEDFELDETENIVIINTEQLQEMTEDFPPNPNYNNFLSVWEREYGESPKSYDDQEEEEESYSAEGDEYEEDVLTDLY